MSEQTVVDNVNPDGDKSGEAVDALDEVDNLLSQYDEELSKDSEPEGEQKDDEVYAYVRRKMQEDQARETQEAVKEAVNVLKDGLDVPVDLPDDILEGLIYKKASEDERFLKAFQNRYSDGKTWKAALKAEQKKLASSFGKVKSEDNEAVASAVRSASTASPPKDETVDFRKMNRWELDEYLRKHG